MNNILGYFLVSAYVGLCVVISFRYGVMYINDHNSMHLITIWSAVFGVVVAGIIIARKLLDEAKKDDA